MSTTEAVHLILDVCEGSDYTFRCRPCPAGWEAQAGHWQGEGAHPWTALVALAEAIRSAEAR